MRGMPHLGPMEHATTNRTVGDALKHLEERINRIANAKAGPMSLSPGEGHLRTLDADGQQTFRADPEGGATVPHRGSQTRLTPLLEEHTTRAENAETRLDGHDQDVSRIDATNTAQDGRMDGHASRIGSAEGRLDTHASRLGNHDNQLSDHNSRIGNVESDIGNWTGSRFLGSTVTEAIYELYRLIGDMQESPNDPA